LTVTAPITGSVTGSSGSTTGNAATATALATARAINGVNFDGTAAITVTAAAGTLSGTTLAAGVTASSLTSLGTIASLTATAGTIANAPSGSTDIANKLYVDTVAQGLDAKASCVAATTADITLSGAQTIDGVSVVAGNRVLVKNQSLSQNNGLYLCASGSWTRTTDANTWDALTSAFTFIEQGTLNGDCGFVCTANAGGTLGTTALPWSQFSGAGTFTAGTGLTLTGSVFSLTSPVAVANGGTGLTSLGSGVATFLGTPSSANLAAAVSDETGSGALVFATSPTLVTPILGTPQSGTVTNLTGTASININGTVGATTPTTGVFTGLTVNDNTTLGSSNTDTVVFNARVASDLNPATDDTYDLGIVGHEWRNLRVDGTANIDSLVADTADINGGTIDGTAIGTTTPSTVAAISLAIAPFVLSAASTSVLRFSGTQAANALQGFDGTNAYGITLFNAGAANVVIQSNGPSSFAGGINTTPIGTGGESTVAATTISATGQITSTLASGTAPFVVSSTTNIPNLNASSLNGATFAAPGAIGSGTASTGAFTTLASTTGANFATSSGNVGVGTASPAAKLHVDSGTQKLVKTVTVNSSTQTIVTNSTEGVSGLCWIRDASVGGQALVLWDVSHGLTIVSQLGAIFTTSSPSATEIQLSVGGTSPYYVQAIAGATRDGDSLSISAINNM
jgi:hypothetical protein